MPPPPKLIDVNVNLSRWPLRRIRYDDTAALAGMLNQKGVTHAWASSFDALLHKDLSSVNARLADECCRNGRRILLPFGSINPKLPDWEEELRRCSDEHEMLGIRLYPNYHGYKLDDPEFLKLLRLATDEHLIVQVALLMEDERMMNPLLRVQQVDTTPLGGVVKEVPGARVVLLNATGKLSGSTLKDLTKAGQVFVEISMLEGVGGISNLLTQVPAHRVLFGSHAPLFYFDSALLKLKESSLNNNLLQLICRGNAERLTK
jgi:predicted TIM-barrel fold metal-dependent hydrolase